MTNSTPPEPDNPLDRSSWRLAELLGEVVREVQARLAKESLAEPPQRKPRPEPRRFVDLLPHASLTNRQVAEHLCEPGARPSDYTDDIKRERSGRDDYRITQAGKERCEAGRSTALYLRCLRAAAPGQRWCRAHHPNPPTVQLDPRELERVRLATLWSRPDGRVLKALYDLTDRVEDLAQTNDELLARMRRLDRIVAHRAPVAWLNTGEASQYTGRTMARISAAAASGALGGVRQGPRGGWSFRLADLDAWMESGRRGRRSP